MLFFLSVFVKQIKSYNVYNGSANGALSSEARLAKIKVDSDFIAPCDTSILYPTDGGNMHCFTAVTQCAVLDVLGPPYNDAEGRHCAYYIEHPFDRIPGIDPHYSLSNRPLRCFGFCLFTTYIHFFGCCICYHCLETTGLFLGGVIFSLIKRRIILHVSSLVEKEKHPTESGFLDLFKLLIITSP